MKIVGIDSLKGGRLVATSGGFDPLHVGHLRCLQKSAEIAKERGAELVVIVNGDGWLKRKKGYSFMTVEERMEIISGIDGVDWVVEWDDGGPTVTGAIEKLQPIAFTKGGDRTQAGSVGTRYRSSKVPEFELCDKIGCDVVFGVGGGKVQSSSGLVKSPLETSWEGVKTDKPWGYEILWTRPGTPYAGKVMLINPHSRMSLQYHEVKEETCLVLAGTLLVEGHSPKEVGVGGAYHVQPNQTHRFGAGDEPCLVVEISTPHLDDVVRVEDDFGRV